MKLRVYVIEWRSTDGDDRQTLVIDTSRNQAWDAFVKAHPDYDRDVGSVANIPMTRGATTDMR